jgi:hypothetical protein
MIGVQVGQGIGDGCNSPDNGGECAALEGLGDGRGDRHGQPGPICLGRLLGQVGVEQRQQPRNGLVMPQELNLADESPV